LLALALLLGCSAISARSAEVKEPATRTEVVFDGADNYTDWNLSDSANGYRESVFTALRSFLSRQAEQLLPEGYKLKVTFTDIDLGGRPSRKIHSASGAPAFEFTYQVTDSSGTVVRQGTENLRHYTDFGNYKFSVETTDMATNVIQGEKPMLKSWAVDAFAGLNQR